MKINIIKGLQTVSIIGFVSVQLLTAGDLSGKVTCKGVRSNAGAVVYIKNIDGNSSPSSEPAEMDQKGLKFEPHILPITVGTTVNFINSDDVLHNVFSPDVCADEFNLGTYPKGEKRSHTFDEEGCFSVVLCNVHPEMEAWILVLQNPYFAVTDENGDYLIKDVPPGNYTVVAWHERLKSKQQKVEVKAGGPIKLDFTLTRR